jgi:HSP20 family protein
MSFDSDFDEIFGDFDILKKFVKKSQGEFDEMLKTIRSGAIKGIWEIREINEPGVKGYSIQGRFGTDEDIDPLEPLKPLKRRPLPEKPFEIPAKAMKEIREPLVDIFEEDNAIKIYAELPGEEKEDIKVSIAEDKIEIKAENFYKITNLPKTHLATEKMSSEYKNGVLEITIPKRKALREKDARNARMI